MQHLEVSGAVRPLKWSLGVKWLMVLVASQKHRPFKNNIIRGERSKSAVVKSREFEGCFSVVTLFLSKKSLTKTGWCAGALS